MSQTLTAVTGRVVAIDGRPRYHLEDCRCVAGKPGTTRLTIEQARTRGLTPCGLCGPELQEVRGPARPPPRSRQPWGENAQLPRLGRFRLRRRR